MSAGTHYEQTLAQRDPRRRKADGVYYTPQPLVDHVIAHTLGRWLETATPAQVSSVTILDPACGCGAFLIAAYRRLLDWHSARQALTPKLRQRILQRSIFGADIDRQAVAHTRRQLTLQAQGERGTSVSRGTASNPPFAGPQGANAPRSPNIRVGDSLLDLAWRRRFTFVLGNPPWGQKDIAKSAARRNRLRERYPSTSGIFDLFRPFVELGVHLTAEGGGFGMVLPDIVLLKNYAPTRRLLLDQLTLDRLDWWGRAFPGALIDAATVVGRKLAAEPHHAVRVTIASAPLSPRLCGGRGVGGEGGRIYRPGIDPAPSPPSPLPRSRGEGSGSVATHCNVTSHTIPQALFAAHPRAVFNLHLTPGRQALLHRLANLPRLGDHFEVHEGVHSGNMRAELFVANALDDSCRPLLFGRDEITPYQLTWHGKHIRLGAVPAARTGARYANLGQRQWHERAKLLVRRTGDRVLAAVDRQGRYASNNFFLVFPRQAHALDLDGLCALLNSSFMTWYFRAIEPRRGRAFAELKIKHLTTFPLPTSAAEQLNALGKQRGLAAEVDALVLDLFGIGVHELE